MLVYDPNKSAGCLEKISGPVLQTPTRALIPRAMLSECSTTYQDVARTDEQAIKYDDHVLNRDSVLSAEPDVMIVRFGVYTRTGDRNTSRFNSNVSADIIGVYSHRDVRHLLIDVYAFDNIESTFATNCCIKLEEQDYAIKEHDLSKRAIIDKRRAGR